MFKDRLADLVAAQSDDKKKEPKMPDNVDEQRDFLARFFAKVEEIREMIDKIQTNVEEMKLKHITILSEPHTDEKIKMELESLMANIKATADKVREELLGIQLDMVELNMEPKIYMNESTLLRMHEIQHSTLSAEFFHIMMEYKRTQTDYRERCKDRIQQLLQIMGRTSIDEKLDVMLKQSHLGEFTQEIVPDTKQATQTLADIKARRADIVNLENSIKEVCDMFGGMAVVTESQGKTTDSIEHFVNHSFYSIESPMKETKKNNGFQSAAQRKIMIAVCLVIVGLIFGTIVGYLGLE